MSPSAQVWIAAVVGFVGCPSVGLAEQWGPPGGANGQFRPGWNGLARTPPMGWRSWNAFGNRITQNMMLQAAAALVSPNRTVAGEPGHISLCDLGYCSVGVDEGWEGCGQGVDHTQHAADGTPTIDAAFPDMKTMVQKIHAMGLHAGWYLNGCKCGERTEKRINYEGDIRSLHNFDFDGVKIDGCGHQRNQTLYAALMKLSGKNYTIENCHWGDCTDSDDSSCPTTEWCPFNWYRSSGDINAGSQSWLSNLQTTIRFQDYNSPLSVPGCWAYPDMLEVGRVEEPMPGTFYTWNRAHFGAWCITSSPLILGLDITDTSKLEPILDIIGNIEAIKINQHWAGHPGTLVENIVSPPVPYSSHGATVPSNSSGDFNVDSPGGIGRGPSDAKSSGESNIRTGGPGETCTIKVGSGVIGNGHLLHSISLAFRYSAGYTGVGEKAPTARVYLYDMNSGKELTTIGTTGPLGNYSYDRFTGYSPEIPVSKSDLELPNTTPIGIALEVTNNERNLQIPIDDLASGWNIRVTWKTGRSARNPYPGITAAPLLSTYGLGQLWAKKQPLGGSAALLINHSPGTLEYTLQISKLNITANQFNVRDIWARKSNGTVKDSLKLTVAPYDSVFISLTPV